MKLKLLAPVRTDFSVVSELSIRDPDRYAMFWDGVAERKTQLHERLPEGLSLSARLEEIHFPHVSAYRRSPYNRYQSLASDSLERPLHVLEIHLDPTMFADPLDGAVLPASAALARYLDGVVWRVFDHGVSLLEVDLALDDRVQTASTEDVAAVLDDLQQAGIALGADVAQRCTHALLEPLFTWLQHEVPDGETFVEPRLGAHETASNGAVLWVTRTLIFEPGDAAHREAIIRHWLKDSGETKGEQGPSLIDQVIADERRHLIRWLNYLFREEAYPPDRAAQDGRTGLTQPFCDAWEAMLYAQFFYAALDVVDVQLTKILAQALSHTHDLKIDELKALLEHNIRKANLLLLQFNDNAKYYKRTVKADLDDILKNWNFETVLVEPVQRKIVLCQERLTLLHQQEAAKSAIYTDMILLGIGITSIFGTSLALAEYGRTMANDADLASYDVDSTNFVDWFAALPTDVILVASSLLSLLLVVLYFYYRQQQTA